MEPRDAEQGQQETETLKSEGLLGVVGQLNASIRKAPGQLWLHTKVETQSIDWLVDTGAAITLIDGETWQTLPHKGPLETEDRKIVGAGGERIKIYGKCQLEARVGTLQLPIVALVGRLAFPAILGLDTLNQWGAVINVGKGTIEVDTQPTPSQHFLEGGDLLVSCINHQAAPQELEGRTEEDEGRSEMFLGEATGKEVPWRRELLDSLAERLSTEDFATASQTLEEARDAFQQSEGELGRVVNTLHRIRTGTARPIKQRVRRLPPFKRAAVETEIRRMLSMGVIEPGEG